MRQDRSVTQILFGFLPDQTVDLQGGTWQVKWWHFPTNIEIDPASVRDAILRTIRPWEETQRDRGYGRHLRSGRTPRVVEVDPNNGVRVAPFPKQWRCKKCFRVSRSNDAPCRCGVRAWGQLPFVAYCQGCGSVRDAAIPRCNIHNDVKMTFPDSSSAREIGFDCPECHRTLSRGFLFVKCTTCGETLQHNVHRAASVYAPRTFTMVNAPNPDRVRRLRDGGGIARALEWAITGMGTRRPPEAAASKDTIRIALRATGLTEEQIEAAVAATGATAARGDDTTGGIDVRHETAAQEALAIAYALDDERVTAADYLARLNPGTELHRLHGDHYPDAVRAAGLHSVELTTRFPLLTGAVGYTRGDTTPGATAFIPFKDHEGEYVVYADLQSTEAWFVRLDPVRVLRWLQRRGHSLPATDDPTDARRAIVDAAVPPTPWSDAPTSPTVGSDVMHLVHTYAHRLIRTTAGLAGIDRDALSEFLVPTHLGFFLYAAARGDFVLGGLEAVFERDLDRVLSMLAHDDHRCALDPGCARHGGACVACCHLGEPSCRAFNRFLDRGALRSFITDEV